MPKLRAQAARFAVYITLRGKITGRAFRYPNVSSPAEAIERALAELTPGEREIVVGTLVRTTTRGG